MDLLTGLYTLEYTNISPVVAHLYEHVYIAGFDKFLREKGKSPSLKGWLSGETFDEVIFLEYGFYSKEIADLFSEYSTTIKSIDKNLVNNEISRIECELKQNTTISDFDKLFVDLELLNKIGFKDIGKRDAAEYINPVAEVSSPVQLKQSNKFNEFDVTISLKSKNNLDVVGLLRLYPLIADSLHEQLGNIGTYISTTDVPVYNKESGIIKVSVALIANSKLHHNEIEGQSSLAISMLKQDILDTGISDYLDVFVNTPTWSHFPLEYYSQTGILASKSVIADYLRDTQNTVGILNNCAVEISSHEEV